MNVLFICTSNKDRSPALEKYFRDKYPSNEYNSAGVNKYFCSKEGTTYLSEQMLNDADVIVFAEDIHEKIVIRDFGSYLLYNREKEIVCLNLGDYEKGNVSQQYLHFAEKTLIHILSNNSKNI